MQYSPLLAPLVALVAWTLVIMAWMAVTRFAAFRKMGITLNNIPPGSRGVNLEGKAPDEAQWKSHNYMHLMEQPTIFYAIVLTLALMGMDHTALTYFHQGRDERLTDVYGNVIRDVIA